MDVTELNDEMKIPMLLSGLTVYLLRHEFDVLKDKWKPFVELVIFLLVSACRLFCAYYYNHAHRHVECRTSVNVKCNFLPSYYV